LSEGLIRTGEGLVGGLRADGHPVLAYLARLRGERTRTVQRGALATVAGCVANEHTTDERGRPIWDPADPLAFDWPKLTYSVTQALRARLLERFAPATAQRTLSALRGVLRECWRLGLMTAEDYQRVADVQVGRWERLPRGRALGAGELRTLFQACAGRGITGVRDAALLALLYGAGLRRAEAVGLDLGDFDSETGTLTVRHGKGDKDRRVYVANGGQRAILAWLEHRGSEPGPLLLAMAKGGRIVPRRLTPHAAFKALASLARRAGVARFGPHDLRRTFVSDLLDNGADIATVAKLAGHAQMETTRRYDRRPEEAKRRAAALLHVPYDP
jgi:integrase